jgi:hypothetical protein
MALWLDLTLEALKDRQPIVLPEIEPLFHSRPACNPFAILNELSRFHKELPC